MKGILVISPRPRPKSRLIKNTWSKLGQAQIKLGLSYTLVEFWCIKLDCKNRY